MLHTGVRLMKEVLMRGMHRFIAVIQLTAMAFFLTAFIFTACGEAGNIFRPGRPFRFRRWRGA